MIRNRLLAVAITAVLMTAATVPTVEARRERETRDEVLFPNATREVERATVQRALDRPIGRMFDLYNEGGKEAEAIEAAQEVIENARAKPYERALAYQIAGLSAYNIDDNLQAIEFIGKALSENALDNNTHYQLMQQLAGAQFNEGLYDDALKTIAQLMTETQAEKPEWYEMQAGAYFETQKYAEAVQAIQKAIALSPQPKENWRQLLMAAQNESGDTAGALATAKQVLDAAPTDKKALMNYASLLLEAERYTDAATLLEDARAKGVLNEERDYKLLISLYYNMEDAESKLISIVEEGLGKGILKPDRENFTVLAQSYYFVDNLAKALEFYQKASELDPSGAVDLNYAKVLNEAERFEESKAAAMRAISEGVDKKGDAWMVVAAAESGLGNDAGVIAAYREAAKYPETARQAQDWLNRNAR